MTTLTLINKDKSDWVWINARLSYGGKPFNSLSKIPGFPRWIKKDESIKIETGDHTEFLYRRSLGFVPNRLNYMYLSDLNRVKIDPDESQNNGYIWPYEANFLNEYPNYQNHFPENKSEISFHNNDVSQQEIKKCIEVITSKQRAVREISITPEVKLIHHDEDNALYFQIYVKLHNSKTGKTGRVLFAEAFPPTAIDLIERFVIRKNTLVAHPRKHKYSLAPSYRSAGFRVPVMIPLADIFD